MKQAVVLIHGMGEQIPMQTLQDFVDVVWVTDDTLIHRGRPDSADGTTPRRRNPVWSKPDARNRSYELRRMTTESAGEWDGTDFYEFYWAHLMHGNTWDHLKAWVLDLLCRSPSRVPGRLRLAWLFLWILSIIIVLGVLVIAAVPVVLGSQPVGWCQPREFCWQMWWPGLATAIVTMTATVFGGFVTGYLGDVARYLRADPPNVARRQEIRERGVELLETLMGVNADGTRRPSEYGRIVVVGHSLGTFIGYDIISHCFARMNTRSSISAAEAGTGQTQLAVIEEMIRKAKAENHLDVDAYQSQQERCLAELAGQGNPWIVSDFITIGSPMAHGEALMAADLADLRKAQERRIFSTCPPVTEFDLKTKLDHISFGSGRSTTDDGPSKGGRYPHHAAPFAFTRWTNIHSPAKWLVWGDLLSGPLGAQFGLATSKGFVTGIRDVPVFQKHGAGFPPLFSHTKYWSMDGVDGKTSDTPDHIKALRRILRLR